MLQFTDDRIPSEPASRWVVANTHPHKERFALENLARQSYSAYCPMVWRRIRHARRTHDVLRPMFPGYVFIEVTKQTQWRSVLSTLGVRHLVRNGLELAYLPHGVVETLREREIDGAVARPEEPLSVGQKVIVQGGPFDGLLATVLKLNDRDRITVLMDLLSQSVKVTVEARTVASHD